MQIKITAENAGKRLDKFLTEKLKKISRSQIQKQIKNNLVVVNGKKVAVHYFIKKEDKIKIANQKQEVKKIKNNVLIKKIKIIEDNNDYLVINKPAGLLTHPDNIHNEVTLLDWAIKKYPESKIVHRLDRDVSGLLIIAKNKKTYEYFKKIFQERKINKIYHAIVHGEIKPDQGIIDRPITRSKKTGCMVAKSTIDLKAKPSITEFEVLKRFKNYTFLKINLRTGRTHQIRVHLSSIGHSIIGDILYKTKNIKSQNETYIKRLFLVATELNFEDPDKKTQKFEIKIPREFASFLKNLQPL